jgi:class 3 adenylate cyclase/tetratricopeptide (TPR) repeat protein
MLDVARWLAEQGLGHHAEAFAEAAIDFDILPELTESDLEKLAIPLGDRKRLLKAIAALVPPPSKTPAAGAATSTSATPAPRPDAERRQLTVMLVDLVGSTELAARLDPEDMGQVIRAYQGCCAETVENWGGHIARYMGDGVLAYFGWPQAHEDDAERAVRAGLALIDALAGAATLAGAPLAARVGIATGLVMVGELIGADEAQERAVVGETPNLAARLQALASPGSVVISQATRRLVGGVFELANLGPQRLKGFAEPVTAWRVEGESRAEGRFEALHGEHLTPLVGREPELGILLDRWQQAKEGEGQLVLLAGEPGIGKSRLVRALHERLAGEPHMPLGHFCSPYHANTALYPVIGLLERAAGLRREDPPPVQLDRLEAILTLATEDVRGGAPLLAELLAIPVPPGRYPPLELSPQERKERTFRALLGQLAGLAARQPVLALYEDAHWADPTTVELIGRVAETVQRLPVLALVTFRPEFTPPWSGHGHMTTLSLSRLSRRQGRAMVERLTGGRALPAEVLEHILARTDGIPLFVEELTKVVLESGILRGDGDRYELAGPLQPLAIPATLQDSLMARLDRLVPVKEVAQVAAVIGREFSHKLFAAISPLPEDKLGAALDQLVASELVFRRGVAPDAAYTFKHALVQQTAYQSLLKSKRRELHARIAQELEQRFREIGETQPEVLARHFTDAGLGDRAIVYWRAAGERAAGRSANVEAVAHLSKGLELIGTLPDAPGHHNEEEELALCLAIGGPLMATRGYSVPEVERTYSRALALCKRLGRSDELFPVLRGLWNYHLLSGGFRQADDLAKRLVELAEEQGAPLPSAFRRDILNNKITSAQLHRALARRARGTALFFLGRFADAMEELEKGIAIDDAVAAWDDRAHLLPYAERAGVVCRLYSAWVLWYLGFPDRAMERMEAGLGLGERLAHANSLAFARIWAAELHIFRREFEAAQACAQATIDLAREHHMPEWLAEAPYAGVLLSSASVSRQRESRTFAPV